MREAAKVVQFEDKVRQAMLGWSGHVKRRDSGYIGQNDDDGGAR